MEVPGGLLEDRLGGVAALQGLGALESRYQARQRAAVNALAHVLGQSLEPVAVRGRGHGVHPLAHGGELARVLGQVHAALLQQCHHGLAVLGDIADLVAGGLEVFEDRNQRGRHIQVVGADVVAPRRVVVVDDGDALVAVGLGLELGPVGHAIGHGRDLLIDGLGHGQLDAGELVDAGRLRGGQHHGLAHALELRHGQLVVDVIRGDAVRR